MSDLEFIQDGGVATVLLNRPERKNAFTLEMIDQWAEALTRARHDDSIRVVVVRGEGQAFCSGVDLGTLDDTGTAPLARKSMLHDRVQRVPHAVAALDKPIIASVSGPAVGAGMDMALMCDLRLASRSATFCESYIRVGLVPGAGGLYFLPRLVGRAKALELFLTGDFVDAEEALRIGLVNRVHDDDELLDATYELAHKIAAGPPVATRVIKRALYQSAETDLATALDLASSHMAVIQSTDDSREALAAFRERRTPTYVGH
ncbi:MAG TPA: enoyl-CoA hydratase [Baekduia sp.]